MSVSTSVRTSTGLDRMPGKAAVDRPSVTRSRRRGVTITSAVAAVVIATAGVAVHAHARSAPALTPSVLPATASTTTSSSGAGRAPHRIPELLRGEAAGLAGSTVPTDQGKILRLQRELP